MILLKWLFCIFLFLLSLFCLRFHFIFLSIGIMLAVVLVFFLFVFLPTHKCKILTLSLWSCSSKYYTLTFGLSLWLSSCFSSCKLLSTNVQQYIENVKIKIVSLLLIVYKALFSIFTGGVKVLWFTGQFKWNVFHGTKLKIFLYLYLRKSWVYINSQFHDFIFSENSGIICEIGLGECRFMSCVSSEKKNASIFILDTEI